MITSEACGIDTMLDESKIGKHFKNHFFRQASLKKWKKLILEISKTENVEYEFKPIDVMVSGINNDIILNSVLIIYRKKRVKKYKIIKIFLSLVGFLYATKNFISYYLWDKWFRAIR